MKMNDDLRYHWGGLLKPIFPDESYFKVDNKASDFKVRISWKIGTGSDRPNKISKIITVLIPAEVADDYSNKNETQQQSDDTNLQDFVSNKLSNHDPDHERPGDQQPPEVEWIASSNVLNS